MSQLPQKIIAFWDTLAKQKLDWIKPWDTVFQGSFEEGKIEWFKGGLLNVSVNCLDRHLASKAELPAIIWEGDKEDEQRIVTFKTLHEQVCIMANVLKKLGIKKGDRGAIYFPLIPEAAIAMLACARIGAIHTVIFAGFSAYALEQRIAAADCKLVISADSYTRGGKLIELKDEVDKALENQNLPVLLIKNGEIEVSFIKDRDYWWSDLAKQVTS